MMITYLLKIILIQTIYMKNKNLIFKKTLFILNGEKNYFQLRKASYFGAASLLVAISFVTTLVSQYSQTDIQQIMRNTT